MSFFSHRVGVVKIYSHNVNITWFANEHELCTFFSTTYSYT